MTRQPHRCPVCRLEHHEPRASNVLRMMILSAIIIAAEVAVALHVDGWAAVIMWLLVLWNVTRVIALTHGLAVLAIKAGR